MSKKCHTTRKGNRVYKRNDNAKNWSFRVVVYAKSHYFNLGKDLQVAKTMADEIDAYLVFNSIEDALDKYSPKRKGKKKAINESLEPTLGDIIAFIELQAPVLDIDNRTIQCYRRSLYRLTLLKDEEAATKPLSFLTKDRLTKYKEHHLLGITDKVEINSKKRTINSVFRNAKSIFSDHAMEAFPSKWDISGINDLKKEPFFRRVAKTYILPSIDLVEKTFELYEKYIDAHPDKQVILGLALFFGLRRAEIAACRRSWVALDSDKAVVSIKHESDFKPKGGKEGYTAGRLSVAESILKNSLGFDKLIKDSARKAERPLQEVIHDLREIGWTRAAPLHECRKLYGSYLASTQGLYVAQSYLRHSNPSVTSQYYASLMPTKKMTDLWVA